MWRCRAPKLTPQEDAEGDRNLPGPRTPSTGGAPHRRQPTLFRRGSHRTTVPLSPDSLRLLLRSGRTWFRFVKTASGACSSFPDGWMVCMFTRVARQASFHPEPLLSGAAQSRVLPTQRGDRGLQAPFVVTAHGCGRPRTGWVVGSLRGPPCRARVGPRPYGPLLPAGDFAGGPEALHLPLGLWGPWPPLGL